MSAKVALAVGAVMMGILEIIHTEGEQAAPKWAKE